MPRLTFPITKDGLAVPAVISLESSIVQAATAQGQRLPPVLPVRAILDTGTTVTGVAPRFLTQLGATPSRATQTQTASGMAPVRFYRISFTIYDPKGSGASDLTRGSWSVTGLPQNLPDVDLLFGMDLVNELVLSIDGPAQFFTLDFSP